MIDRDIYYSLIVLSTSPILVFLIFQINYCGGDFFFLECRSFFSNKDNELQWGACVSLSVYKERETGRLKDLGEGGGGYSP